MMVRKIPGAIHIMHVLSGQCFQLYAIFLNADGTPNMFYHTFPQGTEPKRKPQIFVSLMQGALQKLMINLAAHDHPFSAF